MTRADRLLALATGLTAAFGAAAFAVLWVIAPAVHGIAAALAAASNH